MRTAIPALIFLILLGCFGPTVYGTDPPDISGLQVWLQSGNITKDANNNVSIWHDSSGSGNDFTQLNSANQPELLGNGPNGNPVVRFKGNDFLDSGSISALDTSEITSFIVFKSQKIFWPQNILFSSYTSGARRRSGDLWGVFSFLNKLGTTARKKNGAPVTLYHTLANEWSIHSMTWTPSDKLYSWLNGNQEGPKKKADADPAGHILTRIGASSRFPGLFFEGKIGEILIYNRSLSNSERQSVEQYLYDKYFADHQGPEVASVSAVGTPDRIIVTFDEEIEETEAETITNYSINNGITVTGATLCDGGKRVDLSINPALSSGTVYTLTINNIKDLNGNIIEADSQENFRFVNIPDNNLTLWLHADGKVTVDEEGKVLVWNDSSGNSNHLTQWKTSKARPCLVDDSVNGKPAVSFDGVRNFLDCKSIPDLETDTITWFIVFRTDNPVKYQNILRNAYANGARFSSKKLWGSFIFNSRLYGHSSSRRGLRKAVKHDIDSNWHMQSVVWKNNDEIEGYLDGEEAMTEAGADAVPDKHLRLRVGVNSKNKMQYLDGEIAEILIYSTELTVTERQQVETYLKNKYFFTGYTVTFIAGPNGDIIGETVQIVADGADCTPVEAVPGTGYHFADWSGDYTGTDNPLTVYGVTEDMTVTANFAQNEVEILTDQEVLSVPEGGSVSLNIKLSAQPVDSVTVNGGITSGDDDITITGGSGLVFTVTNWDTYQQMTISAAEDNNDTVNGSAVLAFTLTGSPDKTVTLNEADDDFTLTVTAGDNGSAAGTGIKDRDEAPYTITAMPDPHYHFVNWTGPDAGNIADVNAASTTINVSADASVQANFAINEYTVTFIAGANGSVTGETVQTVEYGNDCTPVTAVPDANYLFNGWSGDVAGNDNPLTVTNVTGDMTVTADFVADSDGDSLADSWEIQYFGDLTQDGNGDFDNDKLSNLEEYTLKTDPTDADTDDDGLTDYFEVRLSLTDPDDTDSDDNGTADGDEDPDADTLTNTAEQAAWMDPHDKALQGDGFLYEITIQEDAETAPAPTHVKKSVTMRGEGTDNWDVFDNDPPGTVSNVVDPDDPGNNVIQLSGSGTDTGYRYTFAEPELVQFKLEWRMKYAESVEVMISCQTTDGQRYLHYTEADSDQLGTGEYVHHGLGADIIDGSWKTVRRELQRDLWDAQPDCDILSVDAFLIRGSGYVDDIVTLAYPDADRDLIPDDVETAVGLDPDDHTDAAGDLDSDGLSNVDEFLLGTQIGNPDSDGDDVTDGTEVDLGSDPLDSNDYPSFTVTFSGGDNGSITGDAVQNVKHGADCTAVTAVPDPGYTFRQWTGDYTGTENPLTITNVTDNMTVTAQYTFTIYVDDSRPDDSGDGATLATAKKTIAAAIALTQPDGKAYMILVAQGTYTGAGNKDLDFNGVDIKLQSIAGAETTIIDCEGSGRALYLHMNETPDSWIDGFTIQNGNDSNGSAIRLENVNPILRNCVFKNNQSSPSVYINNSPVTIENCKFSGNMFTGNGAGILFLNTNGYSVENCVFEENYALNNRGGAIYSLYSNGSLTGCTIKNNSAGTGGALFSANADTVFTSCRFENNYSTSGGGGAIYTGNGNNSFINCLFTSNHAAYRGGAICSAGNTLTVLNIVNSTFSDNTSDNLNTAIEASAGYTTDLSVTNSIIGNPVSITDGTVDINYSCTLDDYTSIGIGNINVDPQLTGDGWLTASSPCIDTGIETGAPATDIHNENRPDGAGVDMGCDEFVDSDSDELPDWYEIEYGAADPSGDEDGDGVSNLDEYITGLDPTGSDTDGDNITDGEEIANGYDPEVYTQIYYVDNSQPDDSGNGLNLATAKKTINAGMALAKQNDGREYVVLVAAGTYTGVENKNLDFDGYNIKLRSIDGAENTIIDCEDSGRGFYLHLAETSDTWIDGFTIKNGNDTQGGAIRLGTNSSPTIKNCIFDSNTSGSGGAVFGEHNTLTISDCVFNNNTAAYTDSGGAVFILNGTSHKISGCTFINNRSNNAGAVYISENKLIIEDSTFIGNKSNNHGGAVYLAYNASIEVKNSVFRDNMAENDGAAIFSNPGLSISLENCVLTGNYTLQNNWSGALYVYTGTTDVDIVNTTFANNDPGKTVTGIRTASTASVDLTVKNSVIWDTISVASGTVNVDYSCTMDDYTSSGSGNINTDPQLTVSGWLTTGSPCIDAGTADGAPEKDIHDQPRPNGSEIDMGCDEFTDSDGDGLPDWFEIKYGGGDLDPDGDIDNDGISNLDEYLEGTDPTEEETDKDNDGLDDDWETENFGDLSQDGNGDPDSDGLNNLGEFNAGTDPNNPDTDDDKMPDGWEVEYELNPLVNDASDDPDNDTVTSYMEYLLERNPMVGAVPDTEGVLQFKLQTPLN